MAMSFIIYIEGGQDMGTGWTRGDTLTAYGVGVALLVGVGGIWATLFNTQFQKWWRRRSEARALITLGDISPVEPYQVPLAPGIIQEDRKTLEVLLNAFSGVDMYWLRTYDFGGSFRWSAVSKLQEYVWNNSEPKDEFLDRDLENMRSALKTAILDFSRLALSHTAVVFREEDDQLRKIPDQYEDGRYSDRLFFKKAGEINYAVESVCATYDELVRSARLKLATNVIAKVAE